MAVTKVFPTQEDDENVIMLVRAHWYVLLLRAAPGILMLILGLILLLVVPIFSRGVATLPFYMPIATLAILSGWLFIFYGWFLWWLNILIITDKHLVDMDQTGLFQRKISALRHENVQDVSASQYGLIPTFLGFGTITIQTAGEMPEFESANIPNPYEVAKKIIEFEERRNGGKKLHRPEKPAEKENEINKFQLPE